MLQLCFRPVVFFRWFTLAITVVAMCACGDDEDTNSVANDALAADDGTTIGDIAITADGSSDGQTSVTSTSGSVNCSQFFAEPDAQVAMGMPFLNSQTFIPLKDGSTVVVQAANSGQMVFFVTVSGSGFSTTGVTMNIEVELPETGVTGKLNIKAPTPKTGATGGYIWLDRGIALKSEAGIDLYSKNEIPLFDNQPAILTTRLFSPCGLDISQTLNVTMKWSSNIGGD